MPLGRWPRASMPKFSGEQRPEFQDPSPHRLVGDIQPTLGEQVFDVAIAERETDIEPNGVPDDRRGELVAGERDRHPPSYPSNGPELTTANFCSISRQTENGAAARPPKSAKSRLVCPCSRCLAVSEIK